MRWNPKKSFLLWTKDTRKHEFTLAGCTLKKSARSQVSRCYSNRRGSIGIENGGKDQKKRKNVLGVLRRLGVFTSGVHPSAVNPTI